MMEQLKEWLEKQGYKLIVVFLIIQSIIFLIFTIIFFYKGDNISDSNKNKIYICGILALFLIFMIHFAYHSIHYAYFYELIAFLIMSLISSILSCYIYIKYIILGSDMIIYTIVGIISLIILVIGNLVYFISAYYAYNIFEEKFHEKLGAKLTFHSLFSWMQINNSMMKGSFGLMILYTLTTCVYDFKELKFLICDSIACVLLLVLIIIMRKNVNLISNQMRSENKRVIMGVLVCKCFLEGYKIYRLLMLSLSDKVSYLENKINFVPLTLLIAFITDEILLVLIIISTIKCIANFGNGFKEALEKQQLINVSTYNGSQSPNEESRNSSSELAKV